MEKRGYSEETHQKVPVINKTFSLLHLVKKFEEYHFGRESQVPL